MFVAPLDEDSVSRSWTVRDRRCQTGRLEPRRCALGHRGLQAQSARLSRLPQRTRCWHDSCCSLST